MTVVTLLEHLVEGPLGYRWLIRHFGDIHCRQGRHISISIIGPSDLKYTGRDTSRDRDHGVKYLSGAEKVKRKKQWDDYIKQQTNNILKYVIETTSHVRQLNEGEGHTAMNQTPLEEENQELNIPVKENEEDTNETELDENRNNRKRAIVQLIKKKILKIWKLKHKKKKTDPSTWPIDKTQQTVNLIVQHGPVQVTQFNFPKNENNRNFSATYFAKILTNGQRTTRGRLIYSKSKDKVSLVNYFPLLIF